MDEESTTIDLPMDEPGSADRFGLPASENEHRILERPGFKSAWSERPILDQGAGRGDPGQVLPEHFDDEPTVRADSDLMRRPAPPRTQQAPGAAERAAGRLVIVAGNDKGKEFVLTGVTVSIGRSLDNDIVLTDIAVSRKHLGIEFDGTRYVLRDRASGNGTLINDRLETGSSTLHHGDRLELGNTVIRLEHPASRHAAGALQAASSGTIDGTRDEQLGAIAGHGPGESLQPPQRRAKPATLPPPLPDPGQGQRALPAPHHEDLPPLSRPRDEPPAPGMDSMSVLPGTPRTPTVAPAIPGSVPGIVIPLLSTRDMRTAQPESMPAASPPPSRMGSAQPDAHARLASTSGLHPDISLGLTASVHQYPPVVQPHLRPGRGWLVALFGVTLGIAGAALGIVLVRGDDSAAVPAGSATGRVPGAAAAALPVSTWGTDETVLVGTTLGKAPSMPDAGDVSDAGDVGDAGDDAAGEQADADADLVIEPLAPEPAPTQAAKPDDSEKPKAAPAEPPKKPAAPDRKPAPKQVTKAAPAPRKVKRAASSSALARKEALGQYKAKSFSAAAKTLRKAASSSGEQKALLALAKGYEQVGKDIAQGESNKASNPVVSLAALQRALSSDKKLGEGTHQSFLRAELGAVAPKAASTYLGQNRYEDAKRALDNAINYGAGSSAAVIQVRKALERKAEELYKGALRMSNKPAQAKQLLGRILKLVPPESPWYAKAYRRINATKSVGDEDE